LLPFILGLKEQPAAAARGERYFWDNGPACESGKLVGHGDDTELAEEKKDREKKSPGQHGLSRKKGFFPGLVILLSLGLIFVGGYWWFYLRGRVSTDDAYVMAHVASVSSRIAGTVSEVLVDNNDPVREGQVLLQIDPRDYQVAVDKAQAVAARIDADIQSEEVTMDLVERETHGQSLVADAALAEAKKTEQAKVHDTDELIKKRSAAQADLTYAQREFNRYEDLYRRGAGSQESRDNALTVLEKTKANLKEVEAQIASSQASFEASQQRTDQAKENLGIVRSDLKKAAVEFHRLASLRAQKNAAQADLEAAKLQLSYCTIKASISGRIAQRSVQVGDRVQTGQPVMAIVPLHAVYVEANFKETQLERVRPGQSVSVQADIYPGHVYHGRVSGIGAGTGAVFSLLPPQNATGNWIKIVQRIPVKIELDQPLPAEYPLRVGLSLQVTIDLKRPEGLAQKRAN
jgi:membrane fusion protein, multidrug efflux system